MRQWKKENSRNRKCLQNLENSLYEIENLNYTEDKFKIEENIIREFDKLTNTTTKRRALLKKYGQTNLMQIKAAKCAIEDPLQDLRLNQRLLNKIIYSTSAVINQSASTQNKTTLTYSNGNERCKQKYRNTVAKCPYLIK